MWESLKERIARLEGFQRITRMLESGEEDIEISGLSGSSRAILLARLLEERGGSMLVVASDPAGMNETATDLMSFGVDNVLLYPDDEVLPYDYHEPDRDLIGMQMKALAGLLEESSVVLVSTLKAVMKRVFEPELFRRMLMNISRGQSYQLTPLLGKLVSLGYERTGIVDEKGQFALRGGILDIFEVGMSSPVRIEFEDDRVISVREFDIESQRSKREIPEITVMPPSPMVVNEQGVERLRAMLEQEAEGETEELKRRLMLPVQRLSEGISFFGMEHYAPVMNQLGSVLDYFPGSPPVVLNGFEELEAEFERFSSEIEERYRTTREEGKIYPEPSSVYLPAESIGQLFPSSRKIRIGTLRGGRGIRFQTTPAENYRRDLERLRKMIKRASGKGWQVFLFCLGESRIKRMEELLEEVSLDLDFMTGEISGGFSWPEAGVLFLSEEEVFGRYHHTYRKPSSGSRSLTYDPSYFKAGDLVVHLDHGVGRYMGMRVLEVEGGKTECLELKYGGGDQLFIPVDRLRMIEKFTNAEEAVPELSRLGTGRWSRLREKARKSAEETARELVEVYAAREVADGHAFGTDRSWQQEMEAIFPYQETPHQLAAVEDVKRDMESERIMDRLLCGDVGFGKTEVALRAAFKAVLSGKQVAFLVPTTVLAMQHYETVSSRLSGFPVRTEVLSRFVPRSRQKKIVKDVAEGKVDITIGTHRLLSGDISFADLGLLIVDEEHRFGVKQKERFKKIKTSVDVLSMTATPIPRTLHMALSGIRDISVIDTPPRNRLPIRTEILPLDDGKIRNAVMREIERGGQVFFVHNRVRSIEVIEGYLRRLLPGTVRIVHAHGQMKERELEKVMISFMKGEFDLLVSTMIIEAGLDFPNVNTIIINHAEKFGLAQLYQLRGRVGRSDRKAYAFLLVPEGETITEEGIQRLKAISEFDYLGAGYRIALKDLEIRGAGNLLGHKQSGHINAVGLELYSRMLKEEVNNLKGEPAGEELEAEIRSSLDLYLPEEYISDIEERMDIYRRLSRVMEPENLEEIREELLDRFGPLPESAANLIRVVGLKLRASRTGISMADIRDRGGTRVEFRDETVPSRMMISRIVEEFEDRVSFVSGETVSVTIRAAAGESSSRATGGPAGGNLLDDLDYLLKTLELFVKNSSLI
ncbi:MAG: transcription-repair coupling factor [Candidatus Latescibacteria bacterium]|nr:transcription-repair coupling factor [bacterium]MBD3423756.1 transcription-repair coupling factor [Candidatus Latescibacterota bacterium]